MLLPVEDAVTAANAEPLGALLLLPAESDTAAVRVPMPELECKTGGELRVLVAFAIELVTSVLLALGKLVPLAAAELNVALTYTYVFPLFDAPAVMLGVGDSIDVVLYVLVRIPVPLLVAKAVPITDGENESRALGLSMPVALGVASTVIVGSKVVLYESTRRMRLFHVSAMSKLPIKSSATPCGWYKLALVLGPPSPLKPIMPFPATVVITSEPAATRRMRSLPPSRYLR